MIYQIIFNKKAVKELQSLPKQAFLSIEKTIDLLSQNPMPVGYKKIQGHENTYRIRQGVYRIIYHLNNKEILITIIKIGHRKDVYKGI